MGVIMALINGDIRLSGLGGSVRRPAVAGSFYPADPGLLAENLKLLLEQTHPAGQGMPKMLIAPHAGYVYSGPVAASAYALLRARAALIRRVVLL
ncbi:MAG: AmmeMemoRadiSam system protein B, partial [Gammaproteobacteria bacterium RIFCSPLOWO2_02_FULL_61_13]